MEPLSSSEISIIATWLILSKYHADLHVRFWIPAGLPLRSNFKCCHTSKFSSRGLGIDVYAAMGQEQPGNVDIWNITHHVQCCPPSCGYGLYGFEAWMLQQQSASFFASSCYST